VPYKRCYLWPATVLGVARYRMSLTTEWTQQAAFDYLADIRNFAKWDPGVVSSVRFPEQDSGLPPGFGATYDVTVKAVTSSTLRYQIEHFEIPNRLVIRASNRWIRSIDEITIAPKAVGVAGCTVTYDAELTLQGVLRVFDVGLAIAFRRIGDRAADGLRRVLQQPNPGSVR
jgi:hypothetical protein